MPIINLIYNAPQRWKPWANTLAYFPLKDNQNDVMGNYTLPLTWTQQTLWYTFNKSWNQDITVNSSQRFCSYRVKINSYYWNAQLLTPCVWWPQYNFNHSSADFTKRFEAFYWSTRVLLSDQVPTTTNTWYHFALWWDGTKILCYLNWNKVAEATNSLNTGTTCKFIQNLNITLSELIYESAARTAQEIQDYYDQTKANYWL